jgi:hypothetical protein
VSIGEAGMLPFMSAGMPMPGGVLPACDRSHLPSNDQIFPAIEQSQHIRYNGTPMIDTAQSSGIRAPKISLPVVLYVEMSTTGEEIPSDNKPSGCESTASKSSLTDNDQSVVKLT